MRILYIVRNALTFAETNDFLAVLVCCPRWHKVAQSVLWRDIVLITPSMIACFLSKLTPQCAVLIRSLTLDINSISSYEETASSESNALSCSLQGLARNVFLMTRLTTLSVILYAALPTWTIPAGTWLRRTDLIALLKSLPASCVNLEINTGGVNWCRENAHLCPIIADMMFRMQHVKLQLKHICESVFLDTSRKTEFVLAPRLQTLVISTDVAYMQPSSRCEHTSVGSSLVPICPLQPIISALIDANRKKSFPVAARLKVFDILYVNWLGPSSWSTINERNILDNKTYQMPWRIMSNLGLSQYVFLRYRGPSGRVRDLIGNFHDIQDIAEGLAFWTTKSLSRLPSTVCCSEVAKAMGYEFEDIEIKMNACRTLHMNIYISPLWNAEFQAGRPLLVGKILDGFPRTSSLSEEQI